MPPPSSLDSLPPRFSFSCLVLFSGRLVSTSLLFQLPCLGERENPRHFRGDYAVERQRLPCASSIVCLVPPTSSAGVRHNSHILTNLTPPPHAHAAATHFSPLFAAYAIAPTVREIDIRRFPRGYTRCLKRIHGVSALSLSLYDQLIFVFAIYTPTAS